MFTPDSFCVSVQARTQSGHIEIRSLRRHVQVKQSACRRILFSSFNANVTCATLKDHLLNWHLVCRQRYVLNRTPTVSCVIIKRSPRRGCSGITGFVLNNGASPTWNDEDGRTHRPVIGLKIPIGTEYKYSFTWGWFFLNWSSLVIGLTTRPVCIVLISSGYCGYCQTVCCVPFFFFFWFVRLFYVVVAFGELEVHVAIEAVATESDGLNGMIRGSFM